MEHPVIFRSVAEEGGSERFLPSILCLERRRHRVIAYLRSPSCLPLHVRILPPDPRSLQTSSLHHTPLLTPIRLSIADQVVPLLLFPSNLIQNSLVHSILFRSKPIFPNQIKQIRRNDLLLHFDIVLVQGILAEEVDEFALIRTHLHFAEKVDNPVLLDEMENVSFIVAAGLDLVIGYCPHVSFLVKVFVFVAATTGKNSPAVSIVEDP